MRRVDLRWNQIVDWRAVMIVGMASALVFLIVNIVLQTVYIGSPELTWRILASVFQGPEVIPPGGSTSMSLILAALAVHIPLSIIFTALIAVVVHEWNFIVSVLVGGVMGLALYAINFYGLAYFFPWMKPMASWLMMSSHIAFGAVAGGLYEAFERDIYQLEAVEV
jgi:hypothetical protein